jgi:sec-independent protein translocase protein TatA
MGPLGTQEIVVIFILALLLFGPKKLPELGRTVAKAMKEFRKAQSELKSTFDREMQNLEREVNIKELTATSFQSDSYNYDGSYESATTTSTTGASATLGAGAAAPLQIEAAAGSIANGHLDTGHVEHGPAPAAPANGHSEPGHPPVSHEQAGQAAEKPVNS